VKAYFNVVLGRARRFHEALNANTRPKVPVSFYLIGGDCKETQNAVLILRNEKKNRWETHFKASSFTTSDGRKVTGEQLKPLLFAVGDGVVTKSSLQATTGPPNGKRLHLPIAGELFQCETHNKLVTSAEIQDKLFALLYAVPVTP
jgi:hypothetical protein